MNAQEKNPPNEDEIKKPSIISQAVPYLFTAAIMVWVFTGMSSNVVDERHSLAGNNWSELKSLGVRVKSIEVRSVDGKVLYFSDRVAAVLESEDLADTGCPEGGDYEIRDEADDVAAAIRRAPRSRIPDRGEVSINYVKKVKFSDIMALVKQADLTYFLPLMILQVLAFFFGDVLSFGWAYRMFNTPKIKVRELMEMRGAPYVIQIGLAALAEVLFPLYMKRVKNVPVTETLSSNIWTLILDVAAIFTVLSAAVIINLHTGLVPQIGMGWLLACILFWTLFLGNLGFWHSPLRGRAAAWIASGRDSAEDKSKAQKLVGELMQLLRTYSLARWDQYLKVYLVRLVMWGFNIGSSYAALRAMGVDPSLPLTLIALPLVVVAIFMPISVGGYGGSQFIAWFLIVKVGQTGTADQVIAYSLLWSTCFLVGRAIVGLVFIRGFWKRCFPEGFKL